MIRHTSYRVVPLIILLLTACSHAYEPTATLGPGQSQARLQGAIDTCREQAKAAVRERTKPASTGDVATAAGVLALAIAAPLSAAAGATAPVAASIGAATLPAGPAVAATAPAETQQAHATAQARARLDELEGLMTTHRTTMDACLRERAYDVATPHSNPTQPLPASSLH